MNITAFNKLDTPQMLATILHCCSCQSWAEKVAASAPFENREELEQCMQKHWAEVSETNLLEAFSAHPKIGDIKVLRDKYAAQAHKEQGQVGAADENVLIELMQFNEEYYHKHGFIFIICASGKSAEFMLNQLKSRLHNTRDEELKIASEEQLKIMLLRLSQSIED